MERYWLSYQISGQHQNPDQDRYVNVSFPTEVRRGDALTRAIYKHGPSHVYNVSMWTTNE